MWLSKQEYRSGLPCPSPGYHPNPGIKLVFLMSLALSGRFFTIWATRETFYMWDTVELMLRLTLQYFGHLMERVDSLEKTLMLGGIGGRRRRGWQRIGWLDGITNPDAGRDWGQEEKGMTEDRMAGWHRRLDAHEFGWTLGVGDGQGGLVCCNSWGHKESDMTEWLNWTELNTEEECTGFGVLFLFIHSPTTSYGNGAGYYL